MTQKSLDYLQNNPAVSEFIKKVNADIDAYYLEMTYEEERLRSIIREAYGIGEESTGRITPNPAADEDNDENDGELDKKPAPPAKKPRRSIR